MNKPVITKIEFTKEQQEEIDKIKNGEPMPRTRIITNKDGRSYDRHCYTKDFPTKSQEKDWLNCIKAYALVVNILLIGYHTMLETSVKALN